jgi:predicted nucleic acid-binding protein
LPSECFIINEWLLHDLRGDNGQEAQEESHRFLRRLKEKCDRIAVLSGSPWMEKAYELMRHSTPAVRTLSKYLHEAILRDSKKCRFLDQNEIKTIPEDVRVLVPQEDLYLVETYYSADASALVTTDKPLYEALSTAQNPSINVRLRDDFLKQYLEHEGSSL